MGGFDLYSDGLDGPGIKTLPIILAKLGPVESESRKWVTPLAGPDFAQLYTKLLINSPVVSPFHRGFRSTLEANKL